MAIGERIIQLCQEPTTTGVKDKFDNVDDLVDRMCQVYIIVFK